MISDILREFIDCDPEEKVGEKGLERASRVVRNLRQSMKPIVDENRAKENKSYLFGVQDMSEVQAMFKEPTKAGVKFWQHYSMEKVRNVVIAEEENSGITFELRSTDPTAVNEKDQDMELLKNRSWIDPAMTAINGMIGLPPYSMINESKLFKGNVKQFDNLGLDQQDSQDINYFATQHYRLFHEMAGEEPVNYFIKYNELDDMIPLLVNDILAVKACAIRTNVNEINGLVDYKYLAPENVKAIRGKRRDFKDAEAIGYEQSMSVSSMMKLIGNSLDENDLDNLLRAVNFHNATSFTGIMDGPRLISGTDISPCNYKTFTGYQVLIGYIEWKEMDASAHKVAKKNKKGYFGLRPTSVYGKSEPNSVYVRDVSYYECTYKAYYLCYGQHEQTLYKYGKLSYQMVEGAEDEYSGYSIIVNQEFGKSAMEIAMPWVDFIEKNAKKFEHMVAAAKKPGRGYNYESLRDIGKSLFPKLAPAKAVDMVMQMFHLSSNEIFTLPTIGGERIGGGGSLNYDIPHGLPPAVLEFKNIIDWADAKIFSSIGISPLRSVYQPGERDAVGIQEQVNENSQKATQYIHRMVNKMVVNISIRTLSYVQDILRFKDINSIPYKSLIKALGDKTVEELEHLEGFAFHRYNIFVNGLNLISDKNEQKAIALQALQRDQIDYEQWLLIRNIPSPKKAIEVLAYEKKRKEKMQQAAAAQQAQAQQQLEQMRHSNKMEELNTEGQWGDKRENTRGLWYAKGQQISSQGDQQKQMLKQQAEPEILEQKMNNQINVEAAKSAMQAQAPITT